MTDAPENPSARIDALIAGITDWRGATFAAVRKAILAGDPEVFEEWKWMGSPVWSRDGIIAVADAHKGKVKVTFDQGAHLEDPKKLFNNGLEGNQRRSIDYLEGDKVDAAALGALIREAAAFNQARVAARKAKAKVKKKP